jgi:DNA sulfur modification protein DndC
MSTFGYQNQVSYFEEKGFKSSITGLQAYVQKLYLADQIPWVIGYSGGKDSTAVTALVWSALEMLEKNQLKKQVFIITNDTLVENPVVSAWVNSSIKRINSAAKEKKLPINARVLHPEIGNTFWVNMVGRGYPAPRPKFRWCTERLKIRPSSDFIRDVVNEQGEVILFLGARRQESITREQAFKRRKEGGKYLARHPELPNTTVCTPIEEWTNDDVWVYLMQTQNPWGHSHKDLLALYRGASDDNECPVVVDTSTPSCGNSRFGCWTCTLVDEDKSMGAMIQNDHQKAWMQPLLDIRNEMDFRGEINYLLDRERRDFRRMSGQLHFYETGEGVGLIPGPYTQKSREDWLRKILTAQKTIRQDERAPEYVRDLFLITPEELEEIRRIWVENKKEIEDRVPEIYEEVMGEPYSGARYSKPIPQSALNLLADSCRNEEQYKLVRNIIALEAEYSTKLTRSGIFEQLEKVIFSGSFESEGEALDWGKNKEVIQ